MTLGLSPAFSRMRMRMWWFREGKNWEMLKARVLVVLSFDHPKWMMWVSAVPASLVDLNFKPLSWLGWMKLLDTTMNCIHSAITFSMSLLRVLRRTIGQNAFRLSYNVLFSLGMTIMVEVLKYLGQWPKLMQASAMLMILERQSSFLMMSFQCCHNILLGPGVEESLHLWIADLNLYLENGFQTWQGLRSTSFRILKSTWRWRTVLKELWRAFHKLLGERHSVLLYLIASVAGSFLFLTQFISSQGPQLMFAISWILLLKKDRLASLTVDLKNFQLSRFLDDL